MSEEDVKDFENAKKCYVCGNKFRKKNNIIKLRDHCHFSGKYRGAACKDCNFRMRKPKFMPVILHNLQNDDSHLFIKSLGLTEGKIKCIAKTEEKYISFSKELIMSEFEKDGKIIKIKRELRFTDSFTFMASSLEKLVKNLDKEKLCCLKTFFDNEKERELLTRKGVFPYDWFDSIEKLNMEKLPKKEELNEKNISDEDYQHACKVWETFQMKTMREYHDLYLKTDAILLADVFENFSKVCKEYYKLDPAWYYTSPGLAWNAMLKMTGIELELISDPNIYLMIEEGARGGISTIMKRYAKANNPYMNEKYNPEEETSYIIYLDANNLYGWAMSKKLPTKGFEWMSDKELKDWKKHPCISEVDLEYPQELHDLHNEYPLAPERIKIDNIDKLIPNLRNKEKYVLHYENLKQYESLGLKIKKIHKGVKFEEKDFMKKYIDFNTELQKKAKN